MSRDIIGFIFDIFILVVVLFIVPVVWQSYQYDRLTQQNMEAITEEFAETVSNKGYIDAKRYHAFVKKLNSNGGTYDIEIVHSQLIHEPEYVGGVFTGNVMDYEEKTYTTTIINEMEQYGAYLMEVGDEIKVCVTPSSKSIGRSFLSLIFGDLTEVSASVSRSVAGCEMETYATYLR